jgi:hypothetical protein
MGQGASEKYWIPLLDTRHEVSVQNDSRRTDQLIAKARVGDTRIPSVGIALEVSGARRLKSTAQLGQSTSEKYKIPSVGSPA